MIKAADSHAEVRRPIGVVLFVRKFKPKTSSSPWVILFGSLPERLEADGVENTFGILDVENIRERTHVCAPIGPLRKRPSRYEERGIMAGNFASESDVKAYHSVSDAIEI
jgi:hypothetical protein